MTEGKDEQERITVESSLFILTHPRLRQQFNTVAQAVLKGIESSIGEPRWNPEKDVAEDDTELDTYTLVFDRKVSVAQFEQKVLNSGNMKFPLRFSIRHFRRPKDIVGTSSSDVEFRESGAGAAEEGAAAAATAVDASQVSADIPERAVPIQEPADSLLYDDKGNLQLAIQQLPNGIFYARFNIIASTEKALTAFLPFEIRGKTEAEVREKFDVFLREDLPNY